MSPGVPIHEVRDTPKTERAGLLLLITIGLAVVLATAYAVLVRAGTPGDEPSHFDTVQFYAARHCLPVLGQPGVSYEGQMGPVYYSLAAVIYGAVNAVAGPRAAFYVLRATDVLLVIPMLMLTRRIVSRILPDAPGVVLVAVAFTALNPSLLAVSASVQNDLLTIVLTLLATDAAVQWLPTGRLTWRRAAWLGVIVSLAVLPASVSPLPLALSWLRGPLGGSCGTRCCTATGRPRGDCGRSGTRTRRRQ